MKEGLYPKYKRTSPEDGGPSVVMYEKTKHERTVTNADVIPYNPHLLLKYRCHINLQIVTTITLVQYLFKYMLKGPDYISFDLAPKGDEQPDMKQDFEQSILPDAAQQDEAQIALLDIDNLIEDDPRTNNQARQNKNNEEEKLQNIAHAQSVLAEISLAGTKRMLGIDAAEAPNPKRLKNEIKEHQKARWLCGPEAAWTIFGFPKYKLSPAVERLHCHLENEQKVMMFPDRHEGPAAKTHYLKLAAMRSEKSKLVQWMSKSRDELEQKATFEDGPAAYELLFIDMPRHYKWNITELEWERRKNSVFKLARIYTVAVKDKERYYLRMLLHHVKGARSFEHLRTVNNVTYETYLETCQQRGLLGDDKEWDAIMEENAVLTDAHQLRLLLLNIFIECAPGDPSNLFHIYSEALSYDFLRKMQRSEDFKDQTDEEPRNKSHV